MNIIVGLWLFVKSLLFLNTFHFTVKFISNALISFELAKNIILHYSYPYASTTFSAWLYFMKSDALSGAEVYG